MKSSFNKWPSSAGVSWLAAAILLVGFMDVGPAASEDKLAQPPAPPTTVKVPAEKKTEAAAAKPAFRSAVTIETATIPDKPAAQPQQDAQFIDWVLKCGTGQDGVQRCALIQRIADQKGRKIVQFTAAKSASMPYLEVSAPLGLSIPYGVALVLPDKSAIKMELADCDPAGCRAVAALNDEALARLRRSERIGVRFQDSKSGKVLTVYGSLKGFAAGVARVMGAG